MPRSPLRLTLRALGALAVVGSLAACRGPEPLDVVIVVIDTLRADRLGAYGNPDGLTPNLDGLAARGVVFEHAYAQSSWTNPSVASLLTSRYQSQHGVTNVLTILQASESTLSEVFWLNGYATGGFSANAGISSERGFSQGYHVWVTYPPESVGEGAFDVVPVRAPVVNQGALEWLDQQPRGKPVFLWLQYMEPHFPYVLPEPPAALDGAPCPDPVKEKLNDPDGPPPPPGVMRGVGLCYDASVQAADAAVGALLEELRRRGRLERTVVAVTSDHGEEILEHGRVGHGFTLYEEVIRVPLIVSVPWLTARHDVRQVVRLIDLAPTLLELAHIAPPKTFEGRSFAAVFAPPTDAWTALRARLRPAPAPPPPPADGALSELLSAASGKHPRRGQHLMSLVGDRSKVIVAEGKGAHDFYDLVADPTEQGTGVALDAARRAALDRALAATLARASQNPSKPVERTLDAETRRQLEMLGYLDAEAE
jgi:arylsulfatase A-like enzyme